MATSTTSRTPPDARRSPRRRGRGVVRGVAVIVVGVLVVAAGTLIGLRLARSGALPGTTVAGVDVGGLDRGGVEERIADIARRKASEQIVAQRSSRRYTATAADLGYRMDIAATVDAVLYRGRQGNPLLAAADQVRAFSGSISVDPVESVDDDALQQWAAAAAKRLSSPPREGGLRFSGATVRTVDPQAGAAVDGDELAPRGRMLALAGTGGTIDAVGDPLKPKTTTEDVEQALALAEQALSAPVTLRRGPASATLTPAEIATVLRDRVVGTDIELRANPQAVRAAIGEDTIAALETEAESARFEISGGSIDLIRGHNGFTYDDKTAARQLLEVATGDGSRNVKLDGTVDEAELTNAEAKDLGITEKVAAFTTYHACCESRVRNIHRIADIVDDVLIQPGETFSLNGFVGERTEAKGFVNGGAIFEGEFVEQVGGGVSQFTTTMYNAAYFGGYDIVEHKAHSYYISRYPVGREATLNYPSVDLKIRNDSPHGMVVSTSYTDESITVAIYGTKWVKVDSVTGERRNITQPETIYKENNDMRRGSSRVIQEAGSEGFDITVTRILTFPDGEVRREPVTTTYLAQPRIIERNT